MVLPVRALGIAVLVVIAAVVVVMVVGPRGRLHAVVGRGVTALCAAQDSAGDLPEAPPGLRRDAVVLDRCPRRVYHLAGYARVGNRDGYPFLLWLYSEARLPAITPT